MPSTWTDAIGKQKETVAVVRHRLSLLPVLMLIGVVLSGCSFNSTSYEFNAGTVDPPREAPPLVLTDQFGEPWDIAAQQGKVVLLYFGYTLCPSACPTTLSDWIEVKRLLGEQVDQVEFVMVTVDPERDSMEKMRAYLDFFDSSFVGLTGTPEALTTIQKDYGIMAVRNDQPDSAVGYLIDHTTSYWVVDPEGKQRLIVSHGTDPELVAEDVRQLL